MMTIEQVSSAKNMYPNSPFLPLIENRIEFQKYQMLCWRW
jgi:hypothetical protein